MDRHDKLMEMIDAAVEGLAELRDELRPWLAYFFESLEAELGEEALHDAAEVLKERETLGGW